MLVIHFYPQIKNGYRNLSLSYIKMLFSYRFLPLIYMIMYNRYKILILFIYYIFIGNAFNCLIIKGFRRFVVEKHITIKQFFITIKQKYITKR